MEIVKELKSMYINIHDKRIENSLRLLERVGKIRYFDDEFYAQFDGMLYNMIPVDFYLKRMSMGKCYDASVVLGLAFGKSDDVFICRGNLKNAGRSIDGTTKFGHGWVEMGGYVYDTTWKIIASKKDYYRIFGTQIYDRRSTKKFFDDCEELSDFNIHDKKYYEEHYSPLAYSLLLQMKSAGALFAQNKTNKRLKMDGEKLLADLPDLDKVYEQYQNAKVQWQGTEESCL